jgi:hypothetical protein
MKKNDATERIRSTFLEAAQRAYEDAGVQGLCAEGRWEAALGALRSVDLEPLLQELREPPGPEGTRSKKPGVAEATLAAWRTNQRVTVFLVSHLPTGAWSARVPGTPRKTIRMLAGHLHNARCMWLKTLGRPQGIPVPPAVDRRSVSRRELVAALNGSGRGIEALLRLGLRRGGEVPAGPGYVWRNLPLDVGHVLAYFVAHEAHHRGQIVLAARQSGCRLPAAVTAGLWQWTKRAEESAATLRANA